jgi:tetratricopeptide (TPR) repeat protein
MRPLTRYAMLSALFFLTACAATSNPQLAAVAEPPTGQEPHAGEWQLPVDPLPPDLMYEVLLGEIAGQRGRLDVAVPAYLRAARVSDDARVAERATRVAVYARDEAAAVTAAKRWIELEPDSLEARQALATLFIRGGQVDRAVAALEEVMALAPDKGSALGMIAGWLSREPDQEAISAVMHGLVERHGEHPDVLYTYAQYALHTEQHEAALAQLDRALAQRPEWGAARMLRAQILVHRGEPEQALAELDRAVAGEPDDLQLRLTYARLLIQADELDRAREQFQLLAELAPDNPDVLYAVSLLTLDADRLQEARSYLLRLVELGHRTEEAYYYLGRITEQHGEPAEALAWYEKVDGGEFRNDAQIRIAALLADQGDIASARERLAEARMADHAQAPRLYIAEAEMLREARLYDEAMHLYDEAVLMLPESDDLLYARALLAERMDRLDLTERDLRTILERDPDNAHALNALGYTLADRTDRHQEALGYIERALALMPEDPAIIDSMGWVQYRLGNYEEALEHLRRAYELSDDPEIAAHLGEVLWVLGEHAEARAVWRRGLEHAPDSEHLLEVMQRLQP